VAGRFWTLAAGMFGPLTRRTSWRRHVAGRYGFAPGEPLPPYRAADLTHPLHPPRGTSGVTHRTGPLGGPTRRPIADKSRTAPAHNRAFWGVFCDERRTLGPVLIPIPLVLPVDRTACSDQAGWAIYAAFAGCIGRNGSGCRGIKPTPNRAHQPRGQSTGNFQPATATAPGNK
jgi:hypothetical protein